MVAFASSLPLSPPARRTLLVDTTLSTRRPACLLRTAHRRTLRVTSCAASTSSSTSSSTSPSTSPPAFSPVPTSAPTPAADGGGGGSASTLATLLVSCADRKGVVAVVAQLLFGFGCNILSSDQYTDTACGRYFQRVTFDFRDLSVSVANVAVLERSIAALAAEYGMWHRLAYHDAKTRVGILVSRTDHCLYDLLLRHRSGELPRSEVTVVISNHGGLERVARHFGVPFVHCAIDKENGGRAAQEVEVERVLAEYDCQCVVLARYMQIMSAGFCERWAGRCINIHHSFLPSFQGGKPYHQAHKRGVKIIGATAHFVSDELDEGPIINQSVTKVGHKDTPGDMIRKGRDLERVTLGTAIRWFLDDRIIVEGSRTIVFED